MRDAKVEGNPFLNLHSAVSVPSRALEVFDNRQERSFDEPTLFQIRRGTLELWNVHRRPWTFGRGVTREFRTFAFGRDVCDSWKIRLAAGLGSFAFDPLHHAFLCRFLVQTDEIDVDNRL